MNNKKKRIFDIIQIGYVGDVASRTFDIAITAAIIINLFIASGIHAGELSALYWEDINLETGMMFIRHTLVKVGGEYVRE